MYQPSLFQWQYVFPPDAWYSYVIISTPTLSNINTFHLVTHTGSIPTLTLFSSNTFQWHLPMHRRLPLLQGTFIESCVRLRIPSPTYHLIKFFYLSCLIISCKFSVVYSIFISNISLYLFYVMLDNIQSFVLLILK